MSVTCQTTSARTEIPAWQSLPQSTTRARRRWGGIFASDEVELYNRDTLQPSIAPPSRGQARKKSGLGAPLPNDNTNGDEVSRRPSLVRSNAVCHRRSRAVSQFSTDSTASNTDPVDIRWSRASSSLEGVPSTAATTPVEGSSPCLDDKHEYTVFMRVPCHPMTQVSGNGTSYQQLSQGFPGQQGFTSQRGIALFEGSPLLKKEEGVPPGSRLSVEERLRISERRAEALEKQNQLLLAQIQKPTNNDRTGPSRNFEELIQRWISTIQHAQLPQDGDTTKFKSEERALLMRRVAELESALRQKTQVIETFLKRVNPPLDDNLATDDLAPILRTDIEQFEKSMVRLKQTDELLSCLGNSFTPRKIILLKLSQNGCRKDAENMQYSQKCVITDDLDAPLKVDQAVKFARSLDARSDTLNLSEISVKTCSICNLPRFLNRSLPPNIVAPHHSPVLDTLSEFYPSFGTTSCCSKPICKYCLPAAIISAITRDWWHNLDEEYWLRCPVPRCNAVLSLRYNVELTSLLGPPGDPGVLTHVRRFELAKGLRQALQGLNTQPSPDDLKRAAELHKQLTEQGFMRDVFDLKTQSGLGRDLLEVLPIDSADGQKTQHVPVFKGLFNKTRTQPENTKIERECIICAESISDLVDGSPEDEERWVNATAGFSGDWTWRVRAFPPPFLLPDCSKKHNLDICRGCLARHLETSLDTVGRAGCDTLSCPLPDCGHVYTYNEIKALASCKTFARYDKYRLVTHLATLPNFRWCLRKGCDSGQIYDSPAAGFGWQSAWGELAASSRIRCDTCRFDMCFKHQVPWHKGLTCEAYDSLKAHGDPAIHATKAWIERNTKGCPGPGCGVPVEKKGGCFHMTCQACKFEFCWECLADWRRILKNRAITGARRYDRKGHNVGCYFRDDGVPEPTMVVGNDIEEATRHM